jgi:hypothetical protein
LSAIRPCWLSITKLRGKRTVHAKSEQMNRTGSIEDRMTLPIVRKAYPKAACTPETASPKPPAETQASLSRT